MTGAAQAGVVVLRQERSPGNSRHLSAQITADGNLLIQGQDLGRAVEEVFGSGEVEWEWTVKAGHIAAFLTALGAAGDILAALQARFSGPDAAGLHAFMKSHAIPFESWSRVGD